MVHLRQQRVLSGGDRGTLPPAKITKTVIGPDMRRWLAGVQP
jgi:hypothetical protein